MIEKDKRIRLPELLAAARDAPCMSCGADDGTIVAAHGPRRLTDSGGPRPHDYAVAYLCVRCHDDVDGRANANTLDATLRAEIWTRAHMRTQRYWWKHGLVVVKSRGES